MYSYDFKEFKRREFLGDGLLCFVSREVICTNHTKLQQKAERYIESNRILAQIAKKLELVPHEGEKLPANVEHGDIKPYANALEVKLYDVYLEQGFDGAKQWFVENIYGNFRNLNGYFSNLCAQIENERQNQK